MVKVLVSPASHLYLISLLLSLYSITSSLILTFFIYQINTPSFIYVKCEVLHHDWLSMLTYSEGGAKFTVETGRFEYAAVWWSDDALVV